MKFWNYTHLIILLFCVTSCSHKEEKKSPHDIGKYVYIDSQYILHTKNRCVLGMKKTDKNGVSTYKSIEFLDTAKLSFPDLERCCSRCVTDEHYEGQCSSREIRVRSCFECQ